MLGSASIGPTEDWSCLPEDFGTLPSFVSEPELDLLISKIPESSSRYGASQERALPNSAAPHAWSVPHMSHTLPPQCAAALMGAAKPAAVGTQPLSLGRNAEGAPPSRAKAKRAGARMHVRVPFSSQCAELERTLAAKQAEHKHLQVRIKPARARSCCPTWSWVTITTNTTHV